MLSNCSKYRRACRVIWDRRSGLLSDQNPQGPSKECIVGLKYGSEKALCMAKFSAFPGTGNVGVNSKNAPEADMFCRHRCWGMVG